MATSPAKDDKAVLASPITHTQSQAEDVEDAASLQKADLLDLESVDPVLNAKMKLVNDAIDEIGFTGYHAKLFVLNGFGYVLHMVFVRSPGLLLRISEDFRDGEEELTTTLLMPS